MPSRRKNASAYQTLKKILRVFLKKRSSCIFSARFMLLLCSSSNPYNSQHPRANMGWWFLHRPLLRVPPTVLRCRCVVCSGWRTQLPHLKNFQTPTKIWEANKRRKTTSLQQSMSISINQQKHHPKCNIHFKTKNGSHMNSRDFSLSNELSFPSLLTYLKPYPSNPHLSGSLWRIVRHVEARAPLGVGSQQSRYKILAKSHWKDEGKVCLQDVCAFSFFFIRWILKCKKSIENKKFRGNLAHKNHHLKSGEVNHTFPSVGQPKMLAHAGEKQKKTGQLPTISELILQCWAPLSKKPRELLVQPGYWKTIGILSK